MKLKELDEAIEILKEYQKWRLGEAPYDFKEDPLSRVDFPYAPQELTQAIDTLIAAVSYEPPVIKAENYKDIDIEELTRKPHKAVVIHNEPARITITDEMVERVAIKSLIDAPIYVPKISEKGRGLGKIIMTPIYNFDELLCHQKHERLNIVKAALTAAFHGGGDE